MSRPRMLRALTRASQALASQGIRTRVQGGLFSRTVCLATDDVRIMRHAHQRPHVYHLSFWGEGAFAWLRAGFSRGSVYNIKALDCPHRTQAKHATSFVMRGRTLHEELAPFLRSEVQSLTREWLATSSAGADVSVPSGCKTLMLRVLGRVLLPAAHGDAACEHARDAVAHGLSQIQAAFDDFDPEASWAHRARPFASLVKHAPLVVGSFKRLARSAVTGAPDASTVLGNLVLRGGVRDPSLLYASGIGVLFAGYFAPLPQVCAMMLAYLAGNPDVHSALRAEVRASRERDFGDCPHLCAVVLECLRLTFNEIGMRYLRLTQADEVFGVRLPKGALLAIDYNAINTSAHHHREPERIDPTRWFEPHDSELEWVAFGGLYNNRRCPARHMNLMLLRMLLGELASSITRIEQRGPYVFRLSPADSRTTKQPPSEGSVLAEGILHG